MLFDEILLLPLISTSFNISAFKLQFNPKLNKNVIKIIFFI